MKSSTTSTPVRTSRGELETLLRRYGASGLSIAQDYAAYTVTVTLILPDTLGKDAANVPVRFPVSILAVYHVLYGKPRLAKYDEKKLAQAERVAWRNILSWVDAQLAAAAIGIQTVTEAFFAHTVVGDHGERMADVVERYQSQLGAGVQRLLTSTTTAEFGDHN